MERDEWFHCGRPFPGSCTWLSVDKESPKDSLKTGFTYTVEVEANNTLGITKSRLKFNTRDIGNSGDEIFDRRLFGGALATQFDYSLR